MARIQLSKVNCKFGAPMGRASEQLAGKVKLQRLRFVDGDYDSGGAYWGSGAPIWVAEDRNGARAYVRASNREKAKAELLKENCELTFYR